MKLIAFFILLFTFNIYAEFVTDLKVKWVVDGDTVHAIKEGEVYKIRLTEIDAPERDQPFGTESGELLKKLLIDGYFAADFSGKDKYGRYLGRIYDNDKDINREMVEQGMAWVYDYYVTDKTFYTNQTSARDNKKGIWSDENPIPPWSWRSNKRN